MRAEWGHGRVENGCVVGRISGRAWGISWAEVGPPGWVFRESSSWVDTETSASGGTGPEGKGRGLVFVIEGET